VSRAALVLAMLATAATTAHADVVQITPVCAAVADGDDAPDRATARAVLQRVLEANDLLVVETGCAETFELRHERTGYGFAVHLRMSSGEVAMAVRAASELPDAYVALARQLLAKQPVAVAPQPVAVAPQPVAEAPQPAAPQERPAIVAAQSQYYGRAGLGAGLGLGAGVRYRNGMLGVDASLNLLAGATSAASIKGEVLLYSANGFYSGAGISLGGVSGVMSSSGGGQAGELTGGYAFHNGKMFVQSDLTMPWFKLDNADVSLAPMFVLSFGIATERL
jgi:hypothetical protein